MVRRSRCNDADRQVSSRRTNKPNWWAESRRSKVARDITTPTVLASRVDMGSGLLRCGVDDADEERAGDADPEKQDVHEIRTIADLSPLPPDGGYGWVIMLASTLINMLVDGVGTGFGMLYGDFLEEFGASKSKTALVGSLISGIYLLCGPISGALLNKYGCRKVAITGSILASGSLFISTYSVDINMLILTYGILTGIGLSMMYLPAIVMVGFYFEKRRALATGVAVCGSGIGGFLFSPLIYQLLKLYEWKGVVWVLSGIVLNGVVAGSLFRPLEINQGQIRKLKQEQRLAAILAETSSDVMVTQSEPNMVTSLRPPLTKSDVRDIPRINVIASEQLFNNTPFVFEPSSLPTHLYPRSKVNLPLSTDCVSEYTATLYSIPEQDTSLSVSSSAATLGHAHTDMDMFANSDMSLNESWWTLDSWKDGSGRVTPTNSSHVGVSPLPMTPRSTLTLNSTVYDQRLPPHLMNPDNQLMTSHFPLAGSDSYRSYVSMDRCRQTSASILKGGRHSFKYLSRAKSRLTISPSKFSNISSDFRKFVSFSATTSAMKSIPIAIRSRYSGHHRLAHIDREGGFSKHPGSRPTYQGYSLQSFRDLKTSKFNRNKRLRPSQSCDDIEHPFRDTNMKIGKSFEEADDIFDNNVLTVKRIKDIKNPMYRKNIFYGGSVLALPEYTSYNDLRSIVRSMTTLPDCDHLVVTDDIEFTPQQQQVQQEDDDNLTPSPRKDNTENKKKSKKGGFGKFLNHTFKQMVDISLMNNKPYCLYVVSNFICGLGFFIPSIYLPVTSQLYGDSVGESAALMSVIGAASTLTRILTGWISDQPWADPLIISNVNLIAAGMATVLYPFCASFSHRIIYCIVFGISTAGFICIRSIIMVRLVGLARLTNAFGLLCMTQGIAALIGPPLAGALFDYYEIYDYAFYMSGSMLLLSGTMCLPLGKLLRKTRELDQRARLAEVLGTTIDLEKPVYLNSLIMDVDISAECDTPTTKESPLDDATSRHVTTPTDTTLMTHGIEKLKSLIGLGDIVNCEVKIGEVNVDDKSQVTKGEFIITTKVQDHHERSDLIVN